jgi:hypothetical protein
MSFVSATPEFIAAAASDLAGIGAAISTANAGASAQTTDILAAAADEVSTQVAALFDDYAHAYLKVSSQASLFHDMFVETANAAAQLYVRAEVANAAAMEDALTQASATAQALLSSAVTTASPSAAATALIMGGTFNPRPSSTYVEAINSLFIQPNPAYTGYSPFGLYTPQGFNIPFISGLTLDQSVLQGQIILNNAIMSQPAGTQTLVFGYSQSTAIITLEMQALQALPANLRPSPSDLSFMLTGNGDNPNGGMLTRMALHIPFLEMSSYGATPADTPYTTTIYTGQYDAYAHFPQYPLNILSTLNAFAGFVYVHPVYAHLSAEQILNAVPLATSPGYYDNGGVTHYYMFPTQNLPLLEPLRAVPLVGNPLAELLQPNLRVLVDLGYNPNGYADYTTPAQLLPGFDPLTELFKLAQPHLDYYDIYLPIYPESPSPDFNPIAIAGQLATGTQQGVTNCLVTLGVLPQSFYSMTYPGVANVAAVAAVDSS